MGEAGAAAGGEVGQARGGHVELFRQLLPGQLAGVAGFVEAVVQASRVEAQDLTRGDVETAKGRDSPLTNGPLIARTAALHDKPGDSRRAFSAS